MSAIRIAGSGSCRQISVTHRRVDRLLASRHVVDCTYWQRAGSPEVGRLFSIGLALRCARRDGIKDSYGEGSDNSANYNTD